MNKVYPEHWSFLLGEIALYSFVVLLLSGTFLTFFDASMREVVYEGSCAPLRGVEMSTAYDSALNLTFDVRGGLFLRQVHHWAALLFLAAIMVHLLRIFFTGAFRRPRETNWLTPRVGGPACSRGAGVRRRAGTEEDESDRRWPPRHPWVLPADRGARRRPA